MIHRDVPLNGEYQFSCKRCEALQLDRRAQGSVILCDSCYDRLMLSLEEMWIRFDGHRR